MTLRLLQVPRFFKGKNMQRELLCAENVTYAYVSDEAELSFALNGVSVSINEGEFVAIVGHNGSGKSTFARLMNGLLLPANGRILVYGMDTADEDKLYEIRRTAGMVFQNPDNQLVATVVDEDVAFGPENIGVPQPEIVERVNAALAAVKMENYAKRAPHMLSGGQKQRVAIAGALALHPAMIVFDEATAMLDPKGRQEVMDIIERLNGEGMTIVFITHFMEEAARADRIIVMSDGLIIKDAAPHDVLADADTLKSAGLTMPFAAHMADELANAGLPVKRGAITTEELLEEICRSL